MILKDQVYFETTLFLKILLKVKTEENISKGLIKL